MTASRARASSSRPTPWWQWLIGIPILIALAVVVITYVWLTFVTPGAGGPIRTSSVPVQARGTDTEGTLKSYLTVTIDGRESRLYGPDEKVGSFKNGEMVEVTYRAGPGGVEVVRWERPPGSTPPAR
jgi:hypothetical protein